MHMKPNCLTFLARMTHDPPKYESMKLDTELDALNNVRMWEWGQVCVRTAAVAECRTAIASSHATSARVQQVRLDCCPGCTGAVLKSGSSARSRTVCAFVWLFPLSSFLFPAGFFGFMFGGDGWGGQCSPFDRSTLLHMHFSNTTFAQVNYFSSNIAFLLIFTITGWWPIMGGKMKVISITEMQCV